jgi:drug/metabolite transporter (DMT)-like permease
VRRSSLTLVAVCAGWGTIPLVVRRVDLPPVAIVFARVWVATLALGAISAVPGLRSERTTAARGGRARVLAAGALLAVHWTSMFAGYQSAPDDTVVFVVFLAPVGIALVAPRALGERLSPRTIGALALAVAGFALVAGPALEPASAGGLAWATLSAATFVALVLVSKPLAEVHGGLRLNLLEMSVAGVLLIPAAVAADWTGIGRAWPWLVLLGLAHTAVGITLYLRTLARVPATHVGILGYVEPVSVVVLAWLVLGDRPSASTAAGGALVLAAGALVVWAAPDRTDRPTPSTTPEVPARVPG